MKSEGQAVCYLEMGGFVGSMAFNRFIQETPRRSARKPRGARDEHQPAEGASAGTSVAEDDAFNSSVGGMIWAAKEALLDVLRGPSVVGNVAMSLVPDVVDGQKDLSKMERSKNTVTATSDVSFECCSSRLCSRCIRSRQPEGIFSSSRGKLLHPVFQVGWCATMYVARTALMVHVDSERVAESWLCGGEHAVRSAPSRTAPYFYIYVAGV